MSISENIAVLMTGSPEVRQHLIALEIKRLWALSTLDQGKETPKVIYLIELLAKGSA